MSPHERAGPLCSALCSKKAYFLAAPATAAEDVLDGSGRVWCRRTMDALGPDGGVVAPEECRAGRSCYEPPAFASPAHRARPSHGS